jgi:hypothetical protein
MTILQTLNMGDITFSILRRVSPTLKWLPGSTMVVQSTPKLKIKGSDPASCAERGKMLVYLVMPRHCEKILV